ncbi:30S ribosomal protein S2 [Candidatus Woesearchaeota archaeon]|nr:30S ribosomal protein S2 [Candidatus Woesearchaeota archaeon]
MSTEPSQFLVPLEQYLKVGIHIGTKYKTKYMESFIYKVRSDGLAVMDVQKIDRRIALAALFLSKYSPEDILVICRRDNGKRAVQLFSELTGIRSFSGRYPPGILTNPSLEDFTEAKVILVTDPWPDKNAIQDAARIGIPVVALCDTNNEANSIDFVVPCNNKGKRSLALFFWIISREYMQQRGMLKNPNDYVVTLEDFSPQN